MLYSFAFFTLSNMSFTCVRKTCENPIHIHRNRKIIGLVLYTWRTHVPGNTSTGEHRHRGTMVPGITCTREHKYQVTQVPGNTSTGEHRYQEKKHRYRRIHFATNTRPLAIDDNDRSYANHGKNTNLGFD